MIVSTNALSRYTVGSSSLEVRVFAIKQGDQELSDQNLSVRLELDGRCLSAEGVHIDSLVDLHDCLSLFLERAGRSRRV